MKTLIAKHKGETVYVHYASKFLEYGLVTRETDGTKQFKVNIHELESITEEELYDMLREQELNEQLKKATHY